MDILLKARPKPEVGDSRCRKKFLLLPRIMDNRFRWLEFAQVNEMYRRYTALTPGGPSLKATKWFEMSWAD